MANGRAGAVSWSDDVSAAVSKVRFLNADEVRTELERILAFGDMVSSRQMSSFLRFVVEQKLAGRDAQIKERTIAIGALDRDADFDPRLDPIVRVVAGKLRRVLERYDLSVGASGALRIAIPKGSYVPSFTSRSASMPEESVTTIERSPCPILRTKLHVPPVTPDFVRPQTLLERLDRYRHLPLTLVSAPAGYGKSTLLSAWLDECDAPGGWLSLDEDDNDLREFVGGLVAAVRTVDPTAAEGTRAMLRAPDLPDVQQLSRRLLNDLDDIDDDFVLVLDDYHVIHHQAVQDLLSEVLRHPPKTMHLVILTREDRPLPLDRLRGRGQVLELSMFDLRFTPAETAELLEKLLQVSLSDAAVRAVNERIEGWPAGLRLLAQSLRHQADPEQAIGSLQGDIASVASYLVSEVLSALPPSIASCLLKLSILDQFCDPLCQRLCADDLREGALNGQTLLTWLREHNLFLISLDREHRWFRFHHLFQGLLRTQLDRRSGVEDAAALHATASDWFERQGLVGHAIRHAMAAGDCVGAAEIFERHRHAELDADRWRNLERWLALLPAEMKRQRPQLLLAQAWTLHDRHQLDDMAAIIESHEPVLADLDETSVSMGEYKLFRGVLMYWRAQGERSRALLEEARDRIPRTCLRTRGLVEIYLAQARQMIGEQRMAVEAIRRESRTSASMAAPLHSRVILAQAFVHAVAGQPDLAAERAERAGAIAKEAGIDYVTGWTRYLQGASVLRSNDLAAAIRHLTPARTDPYVMHTRSAIDALVGLALAEQATGRPDAADDTMGQLLEFARATGDAKHLAVARSGQARLALARDDVDTAARWARTFRDDERPATALFIWLENPALTWIRILIEVGSQEDLERASLGLARIRGELESIHNTCQLIDVAVLEALVLHRRERSDEAMRALARAVALAEPGGCVWPFVEPGSTMAGLLERLVEEGAGHGSYARRLLTASATAGRAPTTVTDR
jgi:LuxR family maltose regulon positive regulatory protein